MAEQADPQVAQFLPQLRIDELIDELQARLTAVRSSRDRVQQLLEAVVAIGSSLDLEHALGRIVKAATTLVDARYGALGVIGADRQLARFITVGVSEEQIAAIGPYPKGLGLLGELIRHPVPLRVPDLSKHPTSYGFPPNHPPMRSFLGVPIRVRDDVYGNLYLTEKRDGARFDADDESVLIALAAAAGVAIENARLYDEARRRQEWLETTSALARGLLSGQSAQDVLADFARRVCSFADAELVVVALPEAEGGDLQVAAAQGAAADRVRSSTIAIEGTTLGTVFKSGEPAVVADSASDQWIDPGDGEHLGLGPALLVPVGTGGHIRGVLATARRSQAPRFDPALEELLRDLAVQAAVVLELAERRLDSEMLSLYADRDRIGRDLHDLAIQRLFAASMTLQGAYKITDKPAVARRIAQTVEDLDDTIKVIRSTIFALHMHEFGDDTPSVRGTMIEVCERASGPLGFSPAVRFTGAVDALVGERVAEHLEAVLGEALSNAARHAGASRVDVELTVHDGSVTLGVSDDGIGIPPGGRCSGLANLRERAAALGGSFEALPGASGGTALTWRVPLGEGTTGEQAGDEGP